MEAVQKKIGGVAGVDLGDKYSEICILDAGTGEVVEESRVRTTPAGMCRRFEDLEPLRVALETGSHSPWVSELLRELGHDVLVANPRRLRLICESSRKTDKADAQYLARIARLDPSLLAPICHRRAETRAHLAVLRTRDALVRNRTSLINHVRGTVKAAGVRLPGCSAESFGRKQRKHLPKPLRGVLLEALKTIEHLTQRIRVVEKEIARLAKEVYADSERLRAVNGVGLITSLAFVLTLEDPERFAESRRVGAYLGLTPRQKESGESVPQLRITKEGDEFLRRLLVGSAQYMLSRKGEDSDLRRVGLKIASRGGKNAKKRAVVAVARRLAVLLHMLWRTGRTYDPLYQSRRGHAAE